MKISTRNGLLGIALCALLTSMFTATAAVPSDFTVTSATDDSTFQLSKHRGKVVVVHFLLKTECPYCLRYTRDYSVLAEKNPEVIHVFLKPDTDAEIRSWAKKIDKKELAESPKVYRDPDAKLADQFEIPNGYKFHGQTVHYPALVALDGNGKELFRYVGKSNSDRMSVKDFKAKLTNTTAK
jgi:thioredoxin-dependent peroxiredoxin